MKRVVTGLDSEGRSCVVSEEHVDTLRGRASGERDSGTLSVLWATDEAPPQLGFDRPRMFPLHETTCPTGGTKWVVVGWQPNVERATVRTNTLDYDTVLEGTCELLLEAGAVELQVGDCVVIPGVVHGWRAGPDGVLLSVVLVGLDGDVAEERATR